MILLTRPYPQSFAIGTVLKKRGLSFFIEPMLTVVPLEPVSLVGHQTLIITSRNALDFLESFRPNVTIYCVGQSLEVLLREKGAVSVRSFAAVLRLVEFIKTKNPQDLGPILYIAGQSKTLDIEAYLGPLGYSIQTKTVYKTESAKILSPDLMDHLKKGEIKTVSFFSKKTAETFINLMRFHGLEFLYPTLVVVSFSQEIANKLKHLPWKNSIITKNSSMNSFWQVIKNHVG